MNILIILGLVFGILFFLIGGIFLGLALYFRKKTGAAQSWPTVPGEVLKVEVKEHADIDEDSSGSTSYEPVVEYQYTVQNQQYTGRRIAFGANRFGHSQAQSAVARYPVGSTVQVRYNPEKPQEAVLEARASGATIFMVVGIILLVIGIASCCLTGIGAFFVS